MNTTVTETEQNDLTSHQPQVERELVNWKVGQEKISRQYKKRIALKTGGQKDTVKRRSIYVAGVLEIKERKNWAEAYLKTY